MCLTCGCNDAHKSMGNNLTYEDVREVAIANGKTVDETLKTMNATAAADKARHTDEYQRPSDIGQD
jgi:hypothetical protein